MNEASPILALVQTRLAFAQPYWLLLLLLLPVLAWLKGKHGRQAAFLYSSVGLVKEIGNISPSSAGKILPMLRWLALACFVVGLARPQWTESDTTVHASGIDIVVALDLSGSMESEDFELKGQRVNRLRDLKSKSKIVILMTDGQNNMGKIPPLTAAEAAHALKVKVYTIGVGTRGMAPFPRGTDMFGRKVYVSVPVDIDEDTLKEIAKVTGGKYFRADSTDTLRSIYAAIDQMEKTEVEVKKYVQYQELFPWIVAGGLGLLLLEIILNHTLWRRLP